VKCDLKGLSILKKKITILGIDESISIFFKDEIEKIFSDLFLVDYRHQDMSPVPAIYNTDLILYTDPEILNLMISEIKCDAPKLMMKRTITREALKKIKKLPDGSRALVANINQYMANETLALIYQLGVTGMQLFPYYKEKSEMPEDIDYIIIPESRPYNFLPEIDAEIILIGNRVFDISNILDILSILRVDSQRAEMIIRKYLVKVPTFWYGFEYSWENRRVLLNQWKLLLDELSNGVIVFDAQEQIELINDKAKEILAVNNKEIIGNNLSDLLKINNDFIFLRGREEKIDELIKYIKLIRYFI